MGEGASTSFPDAGEGNRRPVVYCLIPAELAPKLHELLRGHFAEDPAVEVVVERRAEERRSGADRRAGNGGPPARVAERRDGPGTGDRRIGRRRAAVEAVGAPELPRRARRYAERIRFVRRLEPAGSRAEDLDTARVVARIQNGDREGFAILYARYFDRIYNYLRGVLRDPHDAEDATQQVFVKLMQSIDSYEHRAQPFRAWMFTVVRNEGIGRLRDQGRLLPTDPAELDRRREEAGNEARSAEDVAAQEPDAEVTDWIGDRNLQRFAERLSPPQRQVLMMRFVLDMSDEQIATATERSPDAVRALRSRAITTLRRSLAAVGRDPGR